MRSSWKPPFVDFTLLQQIYSTPNRDIYTQSRNSTILKSFVGRLFFIHQGVKFNKVLITISMVGHKLGEFSFTRRIGKIHMIKKK